MITYETGTEIFEAINLHQVTTTREASSDSQTYLELLVYIPPELIKIIKTSEAITNARIACKFSISEGRILIERINAHIEKIFPKEEKKGK